MIGLKMDELTEAEAIALATALNVSGSSVSLFTNNVPLTRDLSFADFTEATFVGYSAFPAGPDWEAAKNGADENLVNLKNSPLWSAGAIIAPFETVYGIVISDGPGGLVKFSAKFTNPILVNVVGQIIQVGVKWNMEANEFELTEIEPDVNP